MKEDTAPKNTPTKGRRGDPATRGAAPEYVAHVRPRPDGSYDTHSLADHLRSVADLAARLAEPFGASEWARLAGRWHDLGKFQPAFQRYIRHSSGYDTDAHPEPGVGRVDHSTAGAIHALEHLGALGPRGRAAGLLLAYVIAGHHAGLPDRTRTDGGRAALDVRIEERTETYEELLRVPLAAEWLPGVLPTGGPGRGSIALWVRMLFSALVDADFLDTEAFMQPDKGRQRSGWKSLEEIAVTFEEFMARKARNDTPVNRVRSEVLAWCRSAAEEDPGLFSLTVPTGGGKTLSSMAFALRHALNHGKRRIIYVIPYTSIIEQTADVLREALGETEPWTVLLEHHSNLDEEHETRRSRLAAENWDAPVVVTTSVQFFESLFASRTGRARKLHNIADSVVVLDEVQLLPADYLRPILDAVQALTDQFRTTFLFMTATQPAWDTSHGETGSLPKLRGIREVVPDPLQLHERLRRVRVRTPRDMTTATEWEDLAEAFVEHPSALCVVNRRQDARVLFEALRAKDPDAVHLSALMCGAHRSEVIAGIRKTLHEGRSIRVVSTQLVEAGVDLDFPVVFRAMAGLDSIAQAAGRCNREGHLSLGEVRVFVPPTSPPPGVLRQAETVTRTMLAEGLTDLLSPWAFRAFFRQLYWLRGENLDKCGICKLLDHDGRVVDLAYAFRTASDRFQIIPGANQVPVVVRWKGHPQATRVERAIAAFEGDAPDRWAFRALQRSLVTLHQWNLRPLLEAGAVSQIHERMFLLVDASLYDDRVGLRLDPEAIRDPEEMVV